MNDHLAYLKFFKYLSIMEKIEPYKELSLWRLLPLHNNIVHYSRKWFIAKDVRFWRIINETSSRYQRTLLTQSDTISSCINTWTSYLMHDKTLTRRVTLHKIGSIYISIRRFVLIFGKYRKIFHKLSQIMRL